MRTHRSLTIFLTVVIATSFTSTCRSMGDRGNEYPRQDWHAPGRDLDNSRAVVDSPIARSSIDQLEEAWRVSIPGSSTFGNIATTPIIVDDTVYLQDLSSNVTAIDLASGELRWKHEYDEPQIGPNGVAVTDGRVFFASDPHTLVALRADSGEELWTHTFTQGGVGMQPQVAEGLVLISTIPIDSEGVYYAGGEEGVLYAFDAASGEEVWHFNTVKSGDLWGRPDINSGGGAWYPPAVDIEEGLVYWGIGNPAPFPGTEEFPNGSSRPGPNLYTNSILAIDLQSGDLRWYDQAIEHDLFDHDLALTAIVRTAADPVVIATGKLGRVRGYDLTTGELRFDTPVGRHQNDQLTELSGPTEVYPGTFGGVLTPPSTADGVVYVATLNAPSMLEPDVPDFGPELGAENGEVVAIDATNGRVRWSTEVSGDPLGGTLVLDDLVFTGTLQGEIIAMDRHSGEVVWTMTAPGGINGWPAASNDTIVWPIGMSDPPTLIALRLDG